MQLLKLEPETFGSDCTIGLIARGVARVSGARGQKWLLAPPPPFPPVSNRICAPPKIM